MRNTERYPVKDTNSLWQVYKTVSFWKVFKNVIVILIGRYIPFFGLKNGLYRKLLKMEVGKHTAFAFMVMVDIMFPEKIKIGDNSIIGYNSTILAHEYLINEYRVREVMIGANSTILPGITIGDNAVVAAGTVVHKNVEAGTFVGGNPMRVIYTKEEMDKRKQHHQA